MDLAAEDDADVVHFILGQDEEFSFADRPDRAPRQASMAFLFSWLIPVNKGRLSGRGTPKSIMRRPPLIPTVEADDFA